MKPFLLLALVVVLPLSGCGIDEYVRKQEVEDGRAKCIDYGFQPGTTEFAQCVQRSVEETQRQNDRAFYERERIRAEEAKQKK